MRNLIHKRYESYDQLIETAKTVIHTLSAADRLAVINAHPRIGLNPAQLSSLSKREQGTENVCSHPLCFTSYSLIPFLSTLC